MKILVFILVCLLSVNASAAQKFKPKVDTETNQKIIEAINYNFDACNREDIDAVMDSCSDSMPGRDQFRNETLKVFSEKDIHYSLVDVEVIEVKPPFALVKMIQKSYTKDRNSEENAEYRSQTGLVTSVECVEYLNTLKCENGTWKLHLIVSEMKPYSFEKETTEEKSEEEVVVGSNGGCANGKCRPTPFNVPQALNAYNLKPPSR